MRTLGLYVHIPFCKSKCYYCDFCSTPCATEAEREAYVRALCDDLRRRAPDASSYLVDTVYFGGGTPTLLSGDALCEILSTVRECYRVAEDAEITAECNPATADRHALGRMREGGFNRLSIGLQSIHERELHALGRIHSRADFERTLRDARVVGFENLSADVMMGIPEQTEKSWQETLSYLCAAELSHVSAYGLIIEEGTLLAARERSLRLPDEETARRMYLRGVEMLAEGGLLQYEISNFARRGKESRHNLHYWNADPFLGFGPAAYSDFEGVRFGNSRDLSAYTEGRCTLESREMPDADERRQEYVMLRMRLAEGIGSRDYGARFGRSLEQDLGHRLAPYLSMGLVERRADGYALTPEGMYVSNAILCEILDL